MRHSITNIYNVEVNVKVYKLTGVTYLNQTVDFESPVSRRPWFFCGSANHARTDYLRIWVHKQSIRTPIRQFYAVHSVWRLTQQRQSRPTQNFNKSLWRARTVVCTMCDRLSYVLRISHVRHRFVLTSLGVSVRPSKPLRHRQWHLSSKQSGSSPKYQTPPQLVNVSVEIPCLVGNTVISHHV